MHLFPDTHFFLHFKHAHEIPWSDITDDPEIHLVVARAVSKELDKKKYEMRGRPQDRARHYVSKLGDIAGNEEPGILRGNDPRIALHLESRRPADWAPPADLDPAWGDDVLLADALAFKHGNPDADVRVLTGDPGLKAKAIAHGLKVVSLSDKPGWELSEEKTPEQKDFENLRRENEELKRVGPVIECTLVLEEPGPERIEVTVTRYPPLSEQVVGELLADLKRRHPKATEFPNQFSGATSTSRMLDLDAVTGPVEWQAPTQGEIDGYHMRYDTWLGEAEALVRGVHDRIEASPSLKDFTITLSNTGNIAAQGVRLHIESVGDFKLSEVDDGDSADDQASPDQDAMPKLGPPPSAPTWKKVPKPTHSASPTRLPPGYQEALAIARGDMPGMGSVALAAMQGDLPDSLGAALTAAAMAGMPGFSHLGLSAAAAAAQHEQLYGPFGSPSLAHHYQQLIPTADVRPGQVRSAQRRCLNTDIQSLPLYAEAEFSPGSARLLHSPCGTPPRSHFGDRV